MSEVKSDRVHAHVEEVMKGYGELSDEAGASMRCYAVLLTVTNQLEELIYAVERVQDNTYNNTTGAACDEPSGEGQGQPGGSYVSKPGPVNSSGRVSSPFYELCKKCSNKLLTDYHVCPVNSSDDLKLACVVRRGRPRKVNSSDEGEKE